MPKLTFLVVTLLVAAHQHGVASQSCRLMPPTATQGLQGTGFTVAVQCAAAEGAVPYPDAVFIGATMFREAPDLKGKIVPFDSLADGDSVPHTDLPPQEWHRGAQRVSFTFAMAAGDPATHVSIVVWDKKTMCAGQPDCPPIGYTLGRVDDDGLPFPVDAWPHPFCDRQALEQIGYLTKDGPGDPAGVALSDEFAQRFQTNDCYRLDPAASPVGLGYSVRRWRLGPVPAP